MNVCGVHKQMNRQINEWMTVDTCRYHNWVYVTAEITNKYFLIKMRFQISQRFEGWHGVYWRSHKMSGWQQPRSCGQVLGPLLFLLASYRHHFSSCSICVLEISLMPADFTGLYSVWPFTERIKSKSWVHFPFEPCTCLHIEKDIPRLTPAGQLSETGLLVMWTSRWVWVD